MQEIAKENELEQTQEEQVEDVELDEPEGEQSQPDQSEAEKSTEPEEVVVTIGDEQAKEEESSEAPVWVKDLRKRYKESQKREIELEAQLKQIKGEVEDKPVLGSKPKLEDHDYDSDAYESALDQWYERKRKYDQVAEQQLAARREEENSWSQKLQTYEHKKSELKVKDFDDAQEFVTEVLSKTQQGIILQGAENPALVVYALGKNPRKAKELSDIKDPVKYAFAIAKLEANLKVSPKKAPPPEKTISGNVGSSGVVDSQLERLREEASRTGDMTKVIRYKASKRKN